MPSGSIWGDCSSQELIDEGTGFFIDQDFKEGPPVPGTYAQGTFATVSSTDSAVSMAGNSTGAAIWTLPMAPFAPNGQTKLWFETNISLESSTAVQAMFVGFATSTGLGSTVTTIGSTGAASSTTYIASLTVSSTGAVTGSTVSTLVIPGSTAATTTALSAVIVASSTGSTNALISTGGYVGFWLHGDVPNNFDAVYQHGGSTAALASTIVVLPAVLTSAQNNPNPANLAYVPTVPPGVQDGLHWVKLGVRIDATYIRWFVNGSQVAKKLIDQTFDAIDSYGGIVEIASASSTSAAVNVDFFRVAAKLF